MLGAAYGWGMEMLFPDLSMQPGSLALVGMGAFFAGAAKAPIAGIVMVCEMTASYSLVAELLIASVAHTMLSRNWTIYVKQVQNKFASPAHRSDMDPDILRSVTIERIVKPAAVIRVNANADLRDLVPQIRSEDAPLCPVYQDDAYIGLLDIPELYKVLALDPEMESALVVQDFLNRTPPLRPDTDAHTAMRVLLRHGVPLAYVGEHGKFYGTVSHADIFKLYENLTRKSDA
jgi:CIC family chloride channel protein